jgi:hypothetical protein
MAGTEGGAREEYTFTFSDEIPLFSSKIMAVKTVSINRNTTAGNIEVCAVVMNLHISQSWSAGSFKG